MAVVANQAAGFDKSMLTICRRIGDVPVRSGCFGRITRYFGHRRLKAGVAPSPTAGGRITVAAISRAVPNAPPRPG